MSFEQTDVSGLIVLHKRNSLSETLLPGGKFGLEKKAVPLTIGVNYLIFSCVAFSQTIYSIETVCWSLVMFALGAGIVTKVRGRWLALMTFSLPIAFSILWKGIWAVGDGGLLFIWLFALIFFSASYSTIKVAADLFKWLRLRKQTV